MKLSLVFLSLVTLALASIPSVEEGGCILSSSATGGSSQATNKPVKSGNPVSKKRLKKRASVAKGSKETSAGAGKKVKVDDDASSATGKSSRTAKMSVRNRTRVPRKPVGVGATEGSKKKSAGEMPSAVINSDKSSQGGNAAQGGFNKFVQSCPKALELIGEYLGNFSVVFEHSWPTARSFNRVAVDSERCYWITRQGVQATSHRNGEQTNLGSPDLSCYEDFQSSHDGRFLLVTGKTKEQISSNSSEKTARWLVHETGTKGLKNVTLESGETSFAGYRFKLSTNGKTLVSTLFDSAFDITGTASVYQIEEHGNVELASKKADFKGYVLAISGNGTRVFMESTMWKLEIRDISGDKSQLVLEIKCTKTTYPGGSCALNSDGSKAAFIVHRCKICIVDVNKEESPISVDQLTAIVIPFSFIGYNLVYDTKDRLYAFTLGSLWFVDPSERKFNSIEEAQMSQGCVIQDLAVSPTGDYIALLLQSKVVNEKGERQYHMVVKRNEEATKDALMRFFRCES